MNSEGRSINAEPLGVSPRVKSEKSKTSMDDLFDLIVVGAGIMGMLRAIIVVSIGTFLFPAGVYRNSFSDWLISKLICFWVVQFFRI